jgi:hypothetical protein
MKLAKRIEMNVKTGVMLIDGEPFGYCLSDDTVTVTAGSNEPTKVNVTLLANDAEITGVEISR